MISLVSVEDIEEGKSKGIEYESRYIFAVRKDNLFHVYWNICPHLGTPLEWQEDQFLDSNGTLIRCATHGALFEIDSGKCLVGPCKGKSLRKIPFIIRNDTIMVEEVDLRAPVYF